MVFIEASFYRRATTQDWLAFSFQSFQVFSMGAKALHTPNFSHPFKPDTPTGTRPQHLMQLPPKRQWPQGNEHAGLENRKVVEVPQEQGQGAASCCANTLEITNPRNGNGLRQIVFSQPSAATNFGLFEGQIRN